MYDVQLELDIERPHKEAVKLFAGPVRRWLPAVAGPDENSWRAETREGPMPLRVEVEAGPVFVHPDGTSWRRLSVRPDPTATRYFLAGLLTPSVEGQLGLSTDLDGQRCTLRFEGQSSRRSAFTGWLERRIVGDLLARSGMRTLLREVAESLSSGSLDDLDSSEPGFGSVVCHIDRDATATSAHPS